MLSIEEYKNFSKEIEKDIFKFIDIKNIINAKSSYGELQRNPF